MSHLAFEFSMVEQVLVSHCTMYSPQAQQRFSANMRRIAGVFSAPRGSDDAIENALRRIVEESNDRGFPFKQRMPYVQPS